MIYKIPTKLHIYNYSKFLYTPETWNNYIYAGLMVAAHDTGRTVNRLTFNMGIRRNTGLSDYPDAAAYGNQ